MNEIIPTFDLAYDGQDGLILANMIYERGYNVRKALFWTGSATLNAEPGEAVWLSYGGSYVTSIYDMKDHGCLVRVTLDDHPANKRRGVVTSAAIYGKDDIDAAAEHFLSLLSRIEVPSGKLEVKFWSNTPKGANAYDRDIEVDDWREVAVNYSTEAREGLTPLMNPEFRPDGAGKMMLWHGPPGTGKTHAIGALADAWRDWCKTHYILDPEAFFTFDANYMVTVLMDSVSDKWNLFIFEDTGELLTADAKQRTGQGLARLLNLADGMLGQGFKCLLLITTNEPFDSMHPAVKRPGRCFSNIVFGPLNTNEIQEWTKVNNLDMNISGEKTLAELYALMGGHIKLENNKEVSTGIYL